MDYRKDIREQITNADGSLNIDGLIGRLAKLQHTADCAYAHSDY